MGKLGGRELNYHSDLDLVFLHEADGCTAGGATSISNDEFVTEVVQRILKALGGGPSSGPLYSVDARLRPCGISGPLVQTLCAFREHFLNSSQVWERMVLTRARVIFATGGFGDQVAAAIRELLARPIDRSLLASEVIAMRRRLEASRSSHDLKRAAGGLADLEFIVQFLLLAHGADQPDLFRPNFWAALAGLRRHGIVTAPIHKKLHRAYDFLRTVEGRLRLIHNRGVSELPEGDAELERLARRLNYESSDPSHAVEQFLADAASIASQTREVFHEIVAK